MQKDVRKEVAKDWCENGAGSPAGTAGAGEGTMWQRGAGLCPRLACRSRAGELRGGPAGASAVRAEPGGGGPAPGHGGSCGGWRAGLRSEHPGGPRRLGAAATAASRPRRGKIGHGQAFGGGEVKGGEAALAGLNWVREYFGKVWRTGGSR